MPKSIEQASCTTRGTAMTNVARCHDRNVDGTTERTTRHPGREAETTRPGRGRTRKDTMAMEGRHGHSTARTKRQ